MSYINKELKKVSKEQLLKALKEVNDKNKADRLQMIRDTNQALVDGFRCISKA